MEATREKFDKEGAMCVWRVTVEEDAEYAGYGAWSCHSHHEVILFPDEASALNGAHQEAIEASWGIVQGPIEYSTDGYCEIGDTIILTDCVMATRTGTTVANHYSSETEGY